MLDFAKVADHNPQLRTSNKQKGLLDIRVATKPWAVFRTSSELLKTLLSYICCVVCNINLDCCTSLKGNGVTGRAACADWSETYTGERLHVKRTRLAELFKENSSLRVCCKGGRGIAFCRGGISFAIPRTENRRKTRKNGDLVCLGGALFAAKRTGATRILLYVHTQKIQQSFHET